MPKKWKDLIDDELTSKKSAEEKADVIIDASDDLMAVAQKHSLTEEDLAAARQRKGN